MIFLMVKKYQAMLLRILVLVSLFSGAGTFILWDHFRVQRDFSELKALLSQTRNQAIHEDRTFLVSFLGKEVVVKDRDTGMIIDSLDVPTLAEVNYDTTFGDNIIVFDGHGTSAYNKRVHGGDIRLNSWLGFRKSIAVNCTGLVSEGIYPGEGDQ